jgi:hypothetical protein
MATKKANLTDLTSINIPSGDTCVLLCPMRRKESDPYPIINLAVFPQGAATVIVEASLSSPSKIDANPDDTTVNWFSWANGAITSASATKDDTLTGSVSAVRVKPTGGAAIVEARV